nr:3-deoxy-7-phosphoheptulonate synthase [Bacillota bacterium]
MFSAAAAGPGESAAIPSNLRGGRGTMQALKVYRGAGRTCPVPIAPGLEIGGEEIIVMAGPCTVEDAGTLFKTAEAVKRSGARMLRGGAYKPRTSPHAFQGLGEEGLILLAEARRRTGLAVVTEVLDPRLVEKVAEHADMLQIGARSMQNFPLLVEVGRSGRPVLLKRGMAATIEEWLLAAEYILSAGGERVVLCERGIRTFDDYARNTLDLAAIAAVKEKTGLPVVVDPSHAAGRADLVPRLARAAVAAGADGLLIEVHPDPDSALVDGRQSLSTGAFDRLMGELAAIAAAVGRRLRQPASRNTTGQRQAGAAAS